MTAFEVSLFLLVVAGIVGISMKVYKRRQDVLYGPYLRPADRFEAQ